MVIVGFILSMIPGGLHWIHPAAGPAAWAYQHSMTTSGRIGVLILVMTIYVPLSLTLFEILAFTGMAVGSATDALFTNPHAYLRAKTIGTARLADTPAASAAYAAAHGFQTATQPDDRDSRSVLLSGRGSDFGQFLRSGDTRSDGSGVVPVLQGNIRGRNFTWYQTVDSDVYAVRLGKVFPHVYVRSLLNPDNSGLSAGHIGNVTPITLEGDFGRYFTAYAAGKDAQVDARQMLTPDIMLAMLLSAPVADFEFLDGTLYASFPHAAASDAAAYAEVVALSPIIGQLVEEQSVSGVNLLSRSFQPPRVHINLGRLAEKVTHASVWLVAGLFAAFILGVPAGHLPKIGKAVSAGFIIVGLVCFAVCTVLIVGLVYIFILYVIFGALRHLLISARVRLLVSSYRRAHPQALMLTAR